MRSVSPRRLTRRACSLQISQRNRRRTHGFLDQPRLDPLLLGSPLRRPHVAVLAALALSTLLALVPLSVLWHLDRRERESPWLFAVASLWDSMFRTRRIDRILPALSRALANAKHELAFRKRRARGEGRNPDEDPLVRSWRDEIVLLC